MSENVILINKKGRNQNQLPKSKVRSCSCITIKPRTYKAVLPVLILLLIGLSTSNTIAQTSSINLYAGYIGGGANQYATNQSIILVNTLTSSQLGPTTTNSSGLAVFTGCVLGGEYEAFLMDQTQKKWLANATDALFIARQFLQIPSGLVWDDMRREVGNVKGAPDPVPANNMVDVLLIIKRFTTYISQFPNQDSWHLDDGNGDPPIYIAPNNANTSFDFYLNEICYGDVNYSHVPINAKTKPSVTLTTRGTMYIKSGLTFEVPVVINDSMMLGAMSLKMYIPDYLIYENITLPGTRDSCSAVNFTDTTLYVGWLKPDGLELKQHDTVFTLVLTARDEQFYKHTEEISIDPISEIVDTSGCINSTIQLLEPRLVMINNGIDELFLKAFPNPANNEINLKFSLPEDGIVTLELCDILGRNRTILLQEFRKSGAHQATFNISELPNGSYTLSLKNNNTLKTEKFVISR